MNIYVHVIVILMIMQKKKKKSISKFILRNRPQQNLSQISMNCPNPEKSPIIYPLIYLAYKFI